MLEKRFCELVGFSKITAYKHIDDCSISVYDNFVKLDFIWRIL